MGLDLELVAADELDRTFQYARTDGHEAPS